MKYRKVNVITKEMGSFSYSEASFSFDTYNNLVVEHAPNTENLRNVVAVFAPGTWVCAAYPEPK